MCEKIILNSGDKVGPYGLIFIKERPDLPKRKQCDFICPECGKIFNCCLYNVKSGNTSKCKKCGIKSRASKRSAHLEGKTFGYLTVLKKSDRRVSNKIMWECKCVCGKHSYVNTQSLISGKIRSCGCKASEFTSQALRKDITGNIYGYLKALYPSERKDKYGRRHWWYFECLNCGSIKEVSISNVTSGTAKSCGCIRSYGEKKISEVLVSMKIPFEKEKSFDSCRNPETNTLFRFDFYLPNQKILIEYDGRQHFMSKNAGWDNENSLKETQYRDSIKSQWCEDHNIPLLRIPYTDFNLISKEYILNLFIEKGITWEL